jgi:hypothetical protein
MRFALVVLMIVSLFALTGCESKWGSAGLGAAGGAAAGAGSYEWKIDQEMDRIREAHREGRMSDEEFRIRKDQIQRMSVLK